MNKEDTLRDLISNLSALSDLTHEMQNTLNYIRNNIDNYRALIIDEKMCAPHFYTKIVVVNNYECASCDCGHRLTTESKEIEKLQVELVTSKLNGK